MRSWVRRLFRRFLLSYLEKVNGMQYSVENVALCLRQGNHAGAEELMQAIERHSTLESLLKILESDKNGVASPYVHFVGVKVLKYFLIRHRMQWLSEKSGTLQYFIDYAYSLGEALLDHSWKPVVAEVCATVAVILKLGCVSESGHVIASDVHAVVRFLSSLLNSYPSPGAMIVHRRVCQRALEEFGLYDMQTRYRGLPIGVHRQCRLLFEHPDLLPTLLYNTFASLTNSPIETSGTVETGLEAITACMLWPSHRFFEEESVDNETCDLFTVSGPLWDSILLNGITDLTGKTESLFRLLASWYASSAIRSAPASPRLVSEVSQLLCSFKGAEWDADMSLRFLVPCFSLCIDIFEDLSGSNTAEDGHLLPIVANSLLRLVTNYTEQFLMEDMVPSLEKYCAMTLFLISRDAERDDENYMASLDDALSGWFGLASYVGRDYSDKPQLYLGKSALRRCCSSLFAAFIADKTATCVVSDDVGGMADAFTSSHIILMAHLGRVSAGESGATLASNLGTIVGSIEFGALSDEIARKSCEGIWLVLKFIQHFIADASEGEQPYIPQCFATGTDVAEGTVVKLMTSLVSVFNQLLVKGIDSAAVYTAYLEALHAYILVYVEAEENIPVYSSAFDEGAGILSFAVLTGTKLLRKYSYDPELLLATCKLFDSILEKSISVRTFVSSLPEFGVITEYVRQCERYHFAGHTRGRLAAFLLTCSPQADAIFNTIVLPLLSPRPLGSLNGMLESLTTFAGLFESLTCQPIIRESFSAITYAAHRLLAESFSQLHDRTIIIESVHCVHNYFTTCSPLLENRDVLVLLDLVEKTLAQSITAMRTECLWLTDDGEGDRVSLMKGIAKLTWSVAQWKALDCFLSEKDTASLSAETVRTVAKLLDSLDARVLCFPDLEDACFSAMEVCAESFTEAFVSSPDSASFLSATLYSLSSDRVSVQRVGIAVATQVASCMQSGLVNDRTICNGLLKVILRTLASGKVNQMNSRYVSAAVINLSSDLPSGTVDEIFEAAARECPSGCSFLQAVYRDLLGGLAKASRPDSFHQSFAESLQNNLSLIRGTHLA